MNKMNKNIVKAVTYSVLGIIVVIGAVSFLLFLRFTGSFLPVYIGGKYIMKNRIIRLILYIVTPLTIPLGYMLSEYGTKFLIKRFLKNKRRRWRLLILV